MKKNDLNCIAKFIDVANASWKEPRFFYRLEDDEVLPGIFLCSDFSEILSLVTAIESMFCGVCVTVTSTSSFKFEFQIF